jgi:hypothetical protein
MMENSEENKNGIYYKDFYDDNSPKTMVVRSGDYSEVTNYFPDGGLQSIERYFKGKLHSVDEIPSIIRFFTNGEEESHTWHKNGEMIRHLAFNEDPLYDEENMLPPVDVLKHTNQPTKFDVIITVVCVVIVLAAIFIV